MRPPIVPASLLGVIIAAGCARVELRPIPCAPPELPAPRSAIAWQDAPGEAVVSGRVVLIAPGHFVGTAVQLRRAGADEPPRTVVVDSTARFRFTDVQPGKYVLAVRRIGYYSAGDTVRVTPGRGAAVLVALARSHVTLDGCGYGHEYVRRPWWRFW